LALVLFLAAQIGSGTIAQTVSRADSPSARLHAAMVLCVGAKHAAPDSPAPVRHHMSDPALAALSGDILQPVALLQEEWTVPPTSHGLIRWIVLPPACGPPARFAGFAYPTGPPYRLI